MLNYLNKCVYLPKIVPLNWGVGELGCMGCLGSGGIIEIEKVLWKAPHMGQHLPNEVACAPPNLLYGKLVGKANVRGWKSCVI